MHSSLTFVGGVGSVTGSNFLLESGDAKILVDCGLFQGGQFAEEANWRPFPYGPEAISVLVVTHAHIDHIGLIPKLVREGFRGRIVSTEATKALAPALLLDSEHLLTEAAAHHGRAVLYEKEDVARALSLWEGVPYRTVRELGGGFSLELLDAGHILGSAMAKLSRHGKSTLFTGDLGGTSILLPKRDSLEGAQYLIMESVYGNRTRKEETASERKEKLARVVQETAERGGVLLIPAFAAERTQEILFELRELMVRKSIPALPTYLDSPLAEKMTEAFLAEPQYFKKEICERIRAGEDVFLFPTLTYVEDARESEALARRAGAKIIIAGSGMSQGGRVLAHEREVLPQKQSTLLIVGYQAAGSLGRQLLEGVRKVRIMGQDVAVRCRIESDFGYSAHLDGPHLLAAAEEAAATLERVFVVMGEPASASFLAQHLNASLPALASAPREGEVFELEL